ncbi:MAG: hypothetical protein LQ343_007818 [Gyalolechia ehrenbergii]|nr:MAG: hypothetical protein LQ343_007818 [Gyalolechia ehrenbergii]
MEAVKQTVAQNFGGGAHQAISESQQFALEQVPSLTGKIAVITGGSEGIGYACSHTMLTHDIKKLFILSVSKEVIDGAVNAVKEEMGQEAAEKMVWLQCDLSDWKKAKETADTIASQTDRIDIMINNAARGIMTYQTTDFGVDRHMALNHMGHVILNSHLLPTMKKTASEGNTVRIVMLASNAHQATPSDCKFESLDELNQDLGPNGQYGRSKLAAILYARYLGRHLTQAHPNILANATHPGFVDTKMSTQDIHEPYPLGGYAMSVGMAPLKKDIFMGAVSTMFAATKTSKSGEYLCPPAVPESGNRIGIMNVLKLQKKYPQFQQNEIFSFQDAFRKLDIEDKGYIDEATVIKATQQSERQPYDVVRQALKEVELDSSRRVELDDYVDLLSKVRGASPTQNRMSTGRSRGFSNAADGNGGAPSPGHQSKSSVSGKIQVQGSSANVTHTINEDERTEFTRHINAVLAGDPDIGNRLPFPTDTFEMFDECKDGLVLAKLINDSVPDTIDERVLNRAGKKIKSLNQFHMTENNNIVINSAKGIGCSVVNIGSGDIIEVREHLILGLIWQIIRRGLLGKIDIKLHPELYRLLEDDETLEQFLRLPPEQILLRWFNYHLKNAKWDKRVTNFSSDVKEGDNYTVLLNQLAPDLCSRSPLQNRDLLQRAEQVLQNADKLSCRKFLSPQSLVAGNPKLNLAFVANLFNTHPGLDPITDEEKAQVEDFDAEGEREARVFTLWLNSLDVQPAVNSLFDDLTDGTILLQAYDKVVPGSVNWRHVNKRPTSGAELMRFKAVENTNYAIELGKQMRFSLVGVQGADITDAQRTLTLGLVWQLMRRDISETLSALAQRLGKTEISDNEMVKWANEQSHKGGKGSSIRSFKDQAIGSGVFLLDVLNGMRSSYVDYDLVTSGRTDDEAYANAKLAISIARKMGATIWLVPEDICQVRSRLVVTFIGSLMATYEKM